VQDIAGKMMRDIEYEKQRKLEDIALSRQNRYEDSPISNLVKKFFDEYHSII
jgi:hypothetical protein